MIDLIFAPFALFMGFMGLLIGVGSIVVTLYAFYDILFKQPAMESLEKLIWVIVIIVFNILGVLVYFIIVKYMDSNPVAEAISSDREHKKIADLERLGDLKDRGILTAEEFAEEKERILGQKGNEVPVNEPDSADDDK